MSRSYGLSVCERALEELSASTNPLTTRVAKAVAELDIIKYNNELSPDVNKAHGKSIAKLCRDYNSVDSSDESFKTFAKRIISLCIDIIKDNTIAESITEED